MASTTTSQYTFSFSLNRGDAGQTLSGSFTVETGITDEIAIAFAKAFQDLPWPVGTSASAYVAKHTLIDSSTQGNLTNGVFS